MQETWKDIKGYEGTYQVSNLGNIKTSRRQGSKGGLLTPYKGGKRLLCSQFSKKWKKQAVFMSQNNSRSIYT